MIVRHKRLFLSSLALLVIGAALLFLPSYGGYCEGYYPNEHYCAAYRMAAAIGDAVETHNSAITVLATICIAAFTYVLYSATKGLVDAAAIQSADMARSIAAAEKSALASEKAADISEKALHAVDRPWIGITGPIEAAMDVGQPLGVVVRLKNYGRSPALQVRIVVGLFSGDPSVRPAAIDIGMSNSLTTRFPGEDFFAKPYGKLPPMSEADIRNIESAAQSLWVHGRIEYSGQTGQQCHTAFRFYYRPGYGLIPTEEGNEAS